MIKTILPLTKNKLEILRIIYEKGETHLLEISRELRIHPFSLKKTFDKLKPFLIEKKYGKTNRVSLNKNLREYKQIANLIEDYRLSNQDKELKIIIKNMENLFLEDNIKVCCLFGSYARGNYTKESDIDLLLIVERKDKNLSKKLFEFKSLFNQEVNPLVLSEKEFKDAVAKKELSVMSLKKPSQRLVIKGTDNLLSWLGVD